MSTTVFISGAAGFIGQAVALAFRRAGYHVLGLVRNEGKSDILKQNEIKVLVGDTNQLDNFMDHLKRADIIIDTTGNALPLLEKTILASSGKSNKPLFIATAGLLSFGDSLNVVDETHEQKHPALKERAGAFQKVLNTKEVRPVVISPGAVYGGSGGMWGKDGFSIKENEDLVLYGNLNKRLCWVHVEDLADVYVRVAKAGHVVVGEFFGIAGPWTPTYQEWKVAAAKATGWKGKLVHIPEIPKDNFFANIFEATVIFNSQKAYNLLGWRERHLGIIAEIDTYFQAYKNCLK